MLSRRDFHRCTLGAISSAALAAAPNSTIHGVMVGLMSQSFHQMPLDDLLRVTADLGFSTMEIREAHTQPPKEPKESWVDYEARMSKWRMAAPLDHYRNIHSRFSDAGITLWAFTHVFKTSDTDEEVDRSFQIARTLGVRYIFSSTEPAAMPRVERFAAKYNLPVGMHNHAGAPDKTSRPEDFALGMEGNPHIGINLDIGHFVAAGYDPVAFIAKHHKRIYGLHVKDRKKNKGPNMPFGEGDTPIIEVLQLLEKNQYKIPALIEYEYKGADSVEEVRKSFEYMKRALA